LRWLGLSGGRRCLADGCAVGGEEEVALGTVLWKEREAERLTHA